MTALTIDLPRNSSRTSTQAVIVPKRALTSDTIADAPSVSFSAASASGEVATDQNWPRPFSCDAQTSAAIGRMTITDKNEVIKPSERAAAAAPSLEWRRDLRVKRPACAVSASGRSSDRAFDRDHSAL